MPTHLTHDPQAIASATSDSAACPTTTERGSSSAASSAGSRCGSSSRNRRVPPLLRRQPERRTALPGQEPGDDRGPVDSGLVSVPPTCAGKSSCRRRQFANAARHPGDPTGDRVVARGPAAVEPKLGMDLTNRVG
ncbi:hypothetical protein SAVIM40S_01962 [Streptomyces avidinii]